MRILRRRRIAKERLDRAVQIATVFIAGATVIAAIGAVWAAVSGTLALSESRSQTRILATEASSAQQAAAAEEGAARAQTQAPLVISCLMTHPAHAIDGLWTFNRDGTSNWEDVPQTFVPSSDATTCQIKNYGRVPALLVRPHFSYIRTQDGICSLIRASQVYGRRKYWAVMEQSKDLPIMGISAGATYTLGLRADTDDFVFIFVPNSASYQTPAENRPSDKNVLGYGVPGFNGTSSLTLEKHGDNAPCLKHSSRGRKAR